jgi:hypothetical protein
VSFTFVGVHEVHVVASVELEAWGDGHREVLHRDGSGRTLCAEVSPQPHKNRTRSPRTKTRRHSCRRMTLLIWEEV